MPLTQGEARFIFEHTLGCRFGTTTQGAAYAFMDLTGEGQDGQEPPPSQQTVLRWLQNPNALEFEPRWDNRLWNTCGVIVSLSAAGTVILVSKAAPTAERYRFASDLARGDGYSFRKCNRLPPDSEILAIIPYGQGEIAAEREDMAPSPGGLDVTSTQVKELYDAVMVAIGKLAKG